MQFTDHTTRVKPMWEGAVIVVCCIATINNERYSIEFYRDPITGRLRNVACLGKADGQPIEDNATHEQVEDMVQIELGD